MNSDEKYLFDINRTVRNPKKFVRVNKDHILIYFPLDGFPDLDNNIRGRLFDVQRESDESSNNYGKWIIDEFNGYPAVEYKDSFEEIVETYFPNLVIEFLD